MVKFYVLVLSSCIDCDKIGRCMQLTNITALTGNFSAGVGIIKTMHTGFKRVHVLHYANAPVLTRKKPDVMI